MRGWESDKSWSDQYMPTIKGILGQCLIKDAPIEEDMMRNTDLIVLNMAAVRIGCRIRRPEYVHSFRNEFTIRYDRPNETETELTKIISGWGDYFFYGFGSETPPALLDWHIGDLKIFRLWFNRELYKRKGQIPGVMQKNADASSNFLVFKWRDLPSEFVISKKTERENNEQRAI